MYVASSLNTHTNTYTYIRAHTYTYIRGHTHMHTHTHTHIHTQKESDMDNVNRPVQVLLWVDGYIYSYYCFKFIPVNVNM